MGSTAVEKSAEQLQREIDELHRQQREVPFFFLIFKKVCVFVLFYLILFCWKFVRLQRGLKILEDFVGEHYRDRAPAISPLPVPVNVALLVP